MRLEKVIAISIVFACGASCADDDFDDDDNDVNDVTATVDGVYVVDGTDAANWDAASTYAATDALDDPFVLAARTGEGGARDASGFDPEHAAAVAAESAGNYFSPASCVTATADGGEVTYELSSCSGPLGLLRTSGMIMVAFSDSSTGDEDAAVPDQVDAGAGSAVLVVDVSSHDLTINSAAATLDAHGTYARDDASGDKVLTLHSKGKHARNGVSVLRGRQRHHSLEGGVAVRQRRRRRNAEDERHVARRSGRGLHALSRRVPDGRHRAHRQRPHRHADARRNRPARVHLQQRQPRQHHARLPVGRREGTRSTTSLRHVVKLLSASPLPLLVSADALGLLVNHDVCAGEGVL